MKKIKVLMVGPARDVKGGMTSVVDNYYECRLDKIVELKYIESVNDKNIFSKIIKMIIGYFKYVKNIKMYDVIHIHVASDMSTYRKAFYIKLAKKYNKKIILHVHGAEYKRFYNECSDKKKEYIKRILNMTNRVIVLSEEWKDFFSEIIDSNKISVIYNAIKIPKDFSKNLNNDKMLFLGRFGERKGIYDLIDVIEKLVKDYKDIELYAGGDGEIEKVKEIVKEKKLENNIHILGWVSGAEKEKYLKECSIYILPSYNEGMPMSLIEGMAYKNVGISTNVGGIPKVIKNKENGILINPGDKEKLYESIKNVLDDPKFKEKLSVNGRKTVEEKFDIEKNIKKLMDIYED